MPQNVMAGNTDVYRQADFPDLAIRISSVQILAHYLRTPKNLVPDLLERCAFDDALIIPPLCSFVRLLKKFQVMYPTAECRSLFPLSALQHPNSGCRTPHRFRRVPRWH